MAWTEAMTHKSYAKLVCLYRPLKALYTFVLEIEKNKKMFTDVD